MMTNGDKRDGTNNDICKTKKYIYKKGRCHRCGYMQWGEYLEFLDLLLELCDKVLFVFQSGVEAADLHVFPEEIFIE